MKVIVIDGIIGVGKTSFVGVLQRHLESKGFSVVVVDEPVKDWEKSGILDRFYSDMKRYAYHFQTIAYYGRIMKCIDAYKSNGEVDYYIMERSCFTDNLFMKMLHQDEIIDELEYSNYKKWCSMWYMLMPFVPSLFILLDADINTCMERVKLRGRSGEEKITLDYQEKLRREHIEFLGSGLVSLGEQMVKSVIIDNNGNYLENNDVLVELQAQIDNCLN